MKTHPGTNIPIDRKNNEQNARHFNVEHPASTWYTTTKPDDAQGLIADEQTGANIAVSYDPKHAHLIAAAPDLLAACKAVAASINLNEHARELARDQAMSAIEKAEAGQ